MTIWSVILLASLIILLLKLAGYLVPASFMERPTPSRVATLLTVALLSALVVTQTLERDHQLALDARLPALAVAALLIPWLPPGIPVLAAAVVALVIGITNWLGADRAVSGVPAP